MRAFLYLLLCVSTIVSAQRVESDSTYAYSEHVDFKILALNKQKTASRGNVELIATKGMRFVTMVLEVENKSSKKQVIDFEKFFLQDKSSELHKVDFVIMAMKLTAGGGGSHQQDLKAKAKRKIIIQFTPPFDKDEIIHILMVDGAKIEMTYKE